jgi:hypothetical protein
MTGREEGRTPEIYEQLCCSRVRARFSDRGWPKDNGLGCYDWTSVTGRPAFRRASMNEVNAPPVSPLP